ncbi:MAG: hypothetical protein HC888_17755, partial [Candidatus Competibacteraceae bacterium]|nr:hypothetical protein [Candidatus Competibacteraceae bacterium]
MLLISSMTGEGTEKYQYYDAHFGRWPTPSEVMIDSAAWIMERTEEGDKIQVIGFDPLLYLYADREPATAYFTATRLRYEETREVHQQRLAYALREERPKIVVEVMRDYMPWMVDNWRSSSETIAFSPDLRDFLDDEYPIARYNYYYQIRVRKDLPFAPSEEELKEMEEVTVPLELEG